MSYELLTKPVKFENPKSGQGISFVVPITLEESVGCKTKEEFISLLEKKICNNQVILEDIDYRIVGSEGKTLHVEVEATIGE